MVKIYILEKNNVPFYVGKAKNTVRRVHKHYIKFGEDIHLEIIDEVKESEWKYWESFWIEQFKVWGFKLENKNKGGGGPTKWTEEQRTRINPSRINKIINHKTRGKSISKTLKKRDHSKYYTKEVRELMSKFQKGISKPFSKEHIKNIAKANLESKGKVVECYNLEDKLVKTFNCLREASSWITKKKKLTSPNIDKQIKDCCNGRQKTCHGYKWKYE